MCIDPSRLTNIRTKLLHKGIPNPIWQKIEEKEEEREIISTKKGVGYGNKK